MNFSVPSESVTFTPEDFRRMNIVNISATMISVYLCMEYIWQSNKIFDNIKQNSEQIEQQSREKETFFACISHEIRNPIQSLMEL